MNSFDGSLFSTIYNELYKEMKVNPREKADSSGWSISPTLFIGLGGFGGGSVSNLKERRDFLLKNSPDDRVKNIMRVKEFLIIDSLDSKSRNEDKSYLGSNTIDEDSYINITSDISDLREFLDRTNLKYKDNPVIDPDVNIYSSTGQGLQQFRELGAALYLRSKELILKKITEEINDITNRSIYESLQIKDIPNVQIVIITGSCGGTGSGIAPLLLEDLLEKKQKDKIRWDISVIFPEPDVYSEVGSDTIHSNGYAFMNDLSRLSKTYQFPAIMIGKYEKDGSQFLTIEEAIKFAREISWALYVSDKNIGTTLINNLQNIGDFICIPGLSIVNYPSKTITRKVLSSVIFRCIEEECKKAERKEEVYKEIKKLFLEEILGLDENGICKNKSGALQPLSNDDELRFNIQNGNTSTFLGIKSEKGLGKEGSFIKNLIIGKSKSIVNDERYTFYDLYEGLQQFCQEIEGEINKIGERNKKLFEEQYDKYRNFNTLWNRIFNRKELDEELNNTVNSYRAMFPFAKLGEEKYRNLFTETIKNLDQKLKTYSNNINELISFMNSLKQDAENPVYLIYSDENTPSDVTKYIDLNQKKIKSIADEKYGISAKQIKDILTEFLMGTKNVNNMIKELVDIGKGYTDIINKAVEDIESIENIKNFHLKPRYFGKYNPTINKRLNTSECIGINKATNTITDLDRRFVTSCGIIYYFSVEDISSYSNLWLSYKEQMKKIHIDKISEGKTSIQNPNIPFDSVCTPPSSKKNYDLIVEYLLAYDEFISVLLRDEELRKAIFREGHQIDRIINVKDRRIIDIKLVRDKEFNRSLIEMTPRKSQFPNDPAFYNQLFNDLINIQCDLESIFCLSSEYLRNTLSKDKRSNIFNTIKDRYELGIKKVGRVYRDIKGISEDIIINDDILGVDVSGGLNIRFAIEALFDYAIRSQLNVDMAKEIKNLIMNIYVFRKNYITLSKLEDIHAPFEEPYDPVTNYIRTNVPDII